MEHKYTSPIFRTADLKVQPLQPGPVPPGGRFSLYTVFPWQGVKEDGVLLDTLRVHPKLAEHLVLHKFVIGCHTAIRGPLPISLLQEARVFTSRSISPRQMIQVELENTFNDTIYFRGDWVYVEGMVY